MESSPATRMALILQDTRAPTISLLFRLGNERNVFCGGRCLSGLNRRRRFVSQRAALVRCGVGDDPVTLAAFVVLR